MKKTLLFVALLATLPTLAQNKATISVDVKADGNVISKYIYGQFAEHLGSCIYGGLWVGENSPIPNTKGYRNDVFNALKELQVPVLRWPGGCFADDYHWKDGIGPRESRPRLVNNNWGGTIEDNSFGTHEFLNLCEMLGCEPYVSANVGSGTVEEVSKWVEYMTADNGPMAQLRKQNGREKPWHVKFFGVGNESWGCGGSMRPEYYADVYRRYSTYCRNYNGNELFKVASGASDYDYDWTEVLMKNIGGRMNGLSLHYYTVLGWNGSKGSATHFNKDDFYWTMGKCLGIEEVLKKHISIMDQYDPKKNVSLMVDEWGTWWDEEPGTIHGHLFQQNTMRDALVASLTLDVFHKYTDRIMMTNIAQVVNVLQSMILTKDDKMVLTPTYYAFDLYKVFQGAKELPIQLTCDNRQVHSERGADRTVPMISSTAAIDTKGNLQIALSNVDLDNAKEVTVALSNMKAKSVTGKILTSKQIDDYNSFDNPNVVKIEAFKGAKITKDGLKINLPAKSIVVLEVK